MLRHHLRSCKNLNKSLYRDPRVSISSEASLLCILSTVFRYGDECTDTNRSIFKYFHLVDERGREVCVCEYKKFIIFERTERDWSQIECLKKYSHASLFEFGRVCVRSFFLSKILYSIQINCVFLYYILLKFGGFVLPWVEPKNNRNYVL